MGTPVREGARESAESVAPTDGDPSGETFAFDREGRQEPGRPAPWIRGGGGYAFEAPAARGAMAPMNRIFERKRWPGPEYHVEVSFRAPLPYVFSWCTDYTPGDAKLEGESYQRKVLRRTRRQVIFEDLEESPRGWSWARYEVELQPPDRWHMEATGNHVQVVGDYQLTARPDGRTQLDLWWRRRPGLLEFTPRPKEATERSGTLGWRSFARELEKDYQSSRRRTGA